MSGKKYAFSFRFVNDANPETLLTQMQADMGSSFHVIKHKMDEWVLVDTPALDFFRAGHLVMRPKRQLTEKVCIQRLDRNKKRMEKWPLATDHVLRKKMTTDDLVCIGNVKNEQLCAVDQQKACKISIDCVKKQDAMDTPAQVLVRVRTDDIEKTMCSRIGADLARTFRAVPTVFRVCDLAAMVADLDGFDHVHRRCRVRKKHVRASGMSMLVNLLDHMTASVLLWHERWLIKPQDPESVHAFRTSIRKLRSVLSFFRPLIGKKEYRSWSSQFRAFMAHFSMLREWDVLGEMLHEFFEKEPGFEHEKKLVLSSFDRKQQEVFESTKKAWDTVEWTKAVVRFRVRMSGVGFWKKKTKDLHLKTYFRTESERRMKKLERMLQQMDKDDLEAWHEFRIACKKMRNVFDVFKNRINGREHVVRKNMKNIQDGLGRMRDCAVNRVLFQTLRQEDSIVAKSDAAAPFLQWLEQCEQREQLRLSDIFKTLQGDKRLT